MTKIRRSSPPDRDKVFYVEARYWSVAGVIIAFAALSIGVYQHFSDRSDRSKALLLDYEAKLPLLFLDAGESDGIVLTFNNVRVRNPYKLVGRLVCSGGAPIDTKDIEAPVELPVAKAAILDAKSTQTRPTDVPARARVQSGKVYLSHGLLNPGDTVPFEILCDGDPGWPLAAARIQGVPKIEQSIPSIRPIGPDSRQGISLMWVVFVIGCILVVDRIRAFRRFRREDPGFAWVPAVAAILLTAMTIAIGYAAYQLTSQVPTPRTTLRAFARHK